MKTTKLVLTLVCLTFLGSCGGGGNSGSSNQNPPPPAATLTSLAVNPVSDSLMPGATKQFTATGHYSDGSSKDVTSSVQWSSSDSSIASVSASGMATAVAFGVVTVTAQSGSLQATATLNVSSAGANLTSIAIAPTGVSIPVHTDQQFTATGSYSDGSSRDLTALVTWQSSSTASATIDVNGLLTGVAAGSTTVSATLGSVTKSTTVTITAPTISFISVTPVGLTLGIGINQQYTATATYSDGSTQDLVSGVTWSSSSTSVATINSSGLTTTVAAGTTTITATMGALSDTSTLTIVPAHLSSIVVSPATPSIAVGTTQQFTAVGNFDDGSTQLLPSVTWTASSSGVSTINAFGFATAVGTGSTTITATSGSVSGNATLTVTAATLVSLAVAPSNSTMAIGTTKQFTATATFSDSSTQDVTASALWSSSNASVATIDNQGLASSVAIGSATITATLGAISGSTSLTIANVHLVSIAITPANPTIAKGTSIKFTATGTFSDGSTSTKLSGLSWKSSKPNIAQIRTSGVAHGKKNGSLTIKATASGIIGTTTLTVSSGTLVSITISPLAPSVAVGSTQQFVATGTFSDTTIQDVTLTTHWSSSSSTIATIANAPSTAGLATANGIGTATIGANSGGITDSTTMSVH